MLGDPCWILEQVRSSLQSQRFDFFIFFLLLFCFVMLCFVSFRFVSFRGSFSPDRHVLAYCLGVMD